MKYKFLIAALLLIGVISCGRKATRQYNFPETPTSTRWEMTWVDPSISYSDSLITIITATKVDSIFVDNADPTSYQIPYIIFHVESPVCPVSVNLYNDRDQVVLSLFRQSLAVGFYKLTFHQGRLDLRAGGPAGFILRADVCGNEQTVSLVLD